MKSEAREKLAARVVELEDAHDSLYSEFAVMESRALKAEARVKELEAKLAAAESRLAAVREYVFDASFDSFYHKGFREILDK